MADPPSINIFSTMRYDTALGIAGDDTQRNLYMPMHHRDRLLQAAVHLDKRPEPDFSLAIDLLKRNDGKDWIDKVASEARRLTDVIWEDTEPGPKNCRARVRVEMRPGQENPHIVAALTAAVPRTLLFPEHDVLTVKPDELDIKWAVFLDSARTPQSEFTSLKTSVRGHYDEAHFRMQNAIKNRRDKARADNKPLDTGLPPNTDPEIILQSLDGLATEGTITTVYFYRNGRWVTPKAEFGQGPQMGTTRRWALENGICVEEDVQMDSIKPGEVVWLSNGVRGFSAGLVAETA